jgi:ketosteroid isomerase-like protein
MVTAPRRKSMTAQADKNAILQLIDSASDALRRRDAQSAVAAYTADALLFDLAPPLAHAVSANEVAAWLDTWEGPVTRETRDVQITVDSDLAFAHFYVHTSAVTMGTKEHAEWWARATLCFTRIDGQWRVVHEHVSVPFYMDGSFRAALDLMPQ